MLLLDVLKDRDLGYKDLEAIERIEILTRLFVATFIDSFCFYRRIDTSEIEIKISTPKTHVICEVFLPVNFPVDHLDIINLFPKNFLKNILLGVNVKVSLFKKT